MVSVYGIYGMMELARCPVLALPVLQKVDATGIRRPLRQHLDRGRSRHDIYESSGRKTAVGAIPQGSPGGMMKFTQLPELAGAVLQKVLARRFGRSDGVERLGRIERLHSAAALDVRRMVVFARVAVLASAGSQIITAIFLLPS